MKKMIIPAALVLFAGCNYHEQLEQEWIGRYRTTLIDAKGTPDKTSSDGFGGQIFTYITKHTYYETFNFHHPYHYRPCYGYWGRYGYHYPYHRYHEYDYFQRTMTLKTKFWIDPWDKIYKVSISD